MNVPIHYTVERTKNRTSRAVFKEGVIVIRLAKRLSLHEEHRHVQDLLRRMVKVVAKEAKRSSISPFQPILDGADQLTLHLPAMHRALELQLIAGKRSRTKVEGNTVKLTVPPGIGKKQMVAWLWRVVASVTDADVKHRVHEVNERTFNVPITTISLRHMKSQWGSCSSFGKITLNSALLFLQPEIFEYVIIHELAHRLHRNHSARFWGAVAVADPEYEVHRRTLRGYRI